MATTNHATISQLSANMEEAKKLIHEESGQWAIVGLARPAAIKGKGYDWSIYETDTGYAPPRWENLGHYLCINSTIAATMNPIKIPDQKGTLKMINTRSGTVTRLIFVCLIIDITTQLSGRSWTTIRGNAT